MRGAKEGNGNSHKGRNKGLASLIFNKFRQYCVFRARQERPRQNAWINALIHSIQFSYIKHARYQSLDAYAADVGLILHV